MASTGPAFPTSPAFGHLSGSNHGPIVTLVNIVLILLTGAVVVARSVIRFRITRLFTVDNVAIFAGLAFAIAETVCVQMAVNHGLGTHEDTVSPSKFVAYSKASYAANILYIFVLACSKISTAELIKAIQPQRMVKLATLAVEVVVALWTISSVFAIAFQCHLPSPWLMTTDRCVNLKALYDYIGVLNILTDIALCLLPIPMMWNIQLEWSKKYLVLTLFAMRLFVPAVTIVQLVYYSHLFSNLPIQTWSATTPWLLTQTVMNISLMAACIPSLRRVVDGLRTRQTGLQVSKEREIFLTSAERTERNGSVIFGWRSTQGSKKLHSKTSKSNFSNMSGRSRAQEEKETRGVGEPMPYGYNIDRKVGNMASVSGGETGMAEKDMNREGWSSRERLHADNGITRTQEYRVEEDDHITRSTSSAGGVSG